MGSGGKLREIQLAGIMKELKLGNVIVIGLDGILGILIGRKTGKQLMIH